MEVTLIQVNESLISKYPCPCCGYLTLENIPPGTYEICDICLWEDDAAQFYNPDEEGGVNAASLTEYQRLFVQDENFFRKPNKYDLRDSNWKPKV
ncbi:hypothetical protein GK047_17215 [Paenibacillus sp. SYP-B3998]|uniref:Cysteine-rich CPCC domain-containing protein n=1 Tax=Paenibacillus sp. SYP-B3998 TaxID=2678564 RepID=A0A6G3ZZV6_9BACL|nr:CPCC family cysteine-rich protein [Paenibacillus sp. SYP-B3998]NEW07743.1 hypothetical protein [Paenibacillus sp. SYP-B3998]